MSELDWLRGLYDRGANPAHVLRDDLKRVIKRIEELERAEAERDKAAYAAGFADAIRLAVEEAQNEIEAWWRSGLELTAGDLERLKVKIKALTPPQAQAKEAF